MADDTPISIKQALNLAPKDAIEAFNRRDELKVSVSWRDLQPEEHARAFTVAKIARLDLLGDIKQSLDRALANGWTFEMWQKDILPQLQKAGWWGRVQDKELTGTDQAVFVGEKRLRTIFRTNMKVAYAAGRWEDIQRAKEYAPYLEYTAVMDRRTRPQHAAWDGIVLPVDHPFWRTHFPPNGWNCRCNVLQRSERDLERKGLKVTTEAELARRAPMDPVSQMPFGRGSQRVLRPKTPMIDHGWNYNVGAESMLGLVEKAAETILRARAAGLHDRAEDLLVELATVLSDDMLKLLIRLIDGGIEPASEAWEDAVAAARRRRLRRSATGSTTSEKLSEVARSRSRDSAGRFADEWDIGGLDYRDLAAGPGDRFVVIGSLRPKTQKLLGAKLAGVRLSGADAKKQMHKRPEVMPRHYRGAMNLISDETVFRDGSNFVVIGVMEGEHWHAVIHPTKNGESYLKSLRKTSLAGIAQLRSRAKIIRE